MCTFAADAPPQGPVTVMLGHHPTLLWSPVTVHHPQELVVRAAQYYIYDIERP